jgi:3-oxoisoapionate decarboxylase
MNRRSFLATGAAALAAATQTAAKPSTPLGIDVFSLRSQGWDAFQFLDHASKQKVDLVFFSETRFLGSLEDANLKKIRARADELNLKLQTGMRSICPTAKMFDPSQGPAEKQLLDLVRIAQILGSPVARAVLGSADDRKTPGGIEKHIEATVKVLRGVRSQIMDTGIKVGIENHAGDMQARELKMLIEEAGKDFTGAVIDPGNSLWALEDPHLTLEVLAPYCVTTGVRDSRLWKTPEGIAVKWVPMGEGNVRIQEWGENFMQLCPGKALALEVIVLRPRIFPIYDQAFWQPYENVRASEFARFLALAEKGEPHTPDPPADKAMAVEYERKALEQSVRFCQEVLKI